MPDLNPLKFQVAIQDEATGQLNKIEQEFQKLQDRTITVKVEGIEDLRNLLSALQHQQVSNIGKDVAAGISDATKGLQEEAQKAIRTSLGQLAQDLVAVKAAIQHDNFTAFSDRIQTCADKVNLLDEAFKKFHVTIGSDAGMKNFMTGLGEVIRNVRTTMTQLQGSGNNSSISPDSMIRSMKVAEHEFERMHNLALATQRAIDNYSAKGFDVRKLETYRDALVSVRNNLDLIRANGDMHPTTGLTASQYLSSEDVNRTVSLLNNELGIYKEIGKELERITRLREKLSSMLSANPHGSNASALSNAIAGLDYRHGLLTRMSPRDALVSTRGDDYIALMETAKGLISQINAETRQAAVAYKQSTREKEQNARVTQQLTLEEQRLAQAFNQTTTAAHGQSQVLSDLKSLATQYLGVWGGQQFLHNIIEIGGQLEMQRLSIGAILQNQSQANDLFNKIKALAVQSPFGVVQLDQMTKQLTAYGFKYSELFDMTKRLADISAATGTSVDRLALALGHVRSEGALSGYTLRQFSMGNIPLLEKLSEKLGKTKKEIREMTKKKEISYEEVESVLKDLTNEGGMFYNMQEVISESVKAKFKNVRDAMDIMYGEMAEGGIGDALKEVANLLMELTRNWKDVATVLISGAGAWGLIRLAMLAHNTVLGETNALVLSSIAAHRQKEASLLRLAGKYRYLTVAETAQLEASKKNVVVDKLRLLTGRTTKQELEARNLVIRKLMVSDLSLALTEKKLTSEDLSRMVATGKLTHEEAMQVIANYELAASNKELAASEAAAMRMTIQHTKVLGIGGKVGLVFSKSIQAIGAALKSFLLNPAMLAMAAITGIIELWQRDEREMEAAEEMGENLYQRSKDAIKNTRQMMQETGIVAHQVRNGKEVDVTKSFGAEFEGEKTILIKPQFDLEEAESTIERWSQYIRDYAGTPKKILNDALIGSKENARDLEEQFNRLGDAVITVAEAQKTLASLSGTFQDAQIITNGGWFDDDVATDLKDYEKSYKNFNTLVARSYVKYQQNIDKAIDKARKQNESFRQATEGMSEYAQMYKYLVENAKEYGDVVATLRVNDAPVPSKEGVVIAEKKAEEELDQYIEGLKFGLKANGKNPLELSDADKQAIIIGFKEFLSTLGPISEESAKKWSEYVYKAFGIAMDDAEEKTVKRFSDWQKRAQKAFVVNQTLHVKSKTITSMDEFVKAVQEDLKKKQEYINRNTSHIRQQFKISPDIKFDTKYIERYMALMKFQIMKLKFTGKREAAEILSSQLNDELIPYYNALRTMQEDKDWLKNEGYPESDKKKDKGSGDKGHKAYKDEEVEKWKERLKNIREAYNEYVKWEKEVGHAAAISEVKKAFDGLLSPEDIENIKEYRKVVEDISKKAKARYESQSGDKSKNNGKAAQDLARDAQKVLANINIDELTRDSDRWGSEMKLQLEEITRKWQLFNEVRNTTGSKQIAAGITGLGSDADIMHNAADAVREEIENAWFLMRDEVKVPIDFDINKSDKQINDDVKSALGTTKYRDRIDGIVESLKKWRDLERDVIKGNITGYAKLIGSAVDYKSQVKKINDELEQQKENNKKLVKSGEISQSDADKANHIAEIQAEDKIWKQSLQYVTLMNSSLALTGKEVRNGVNEAMSHLNILLKNNLITAKEYADEMEKLRKIQDGWNANALFGANNATTSFMKEGLNGLVQYYERIVKLADLTKRNTGSTAQQKADAEKQLEKYKPILTKLVETREKLNGVALVSEAVMGAFDGLQKSSQSLSEMFDALGNESAANFWSDMANTIGGISSIFAPVNNMLQQAMSGSIGGMLSSALSAPISMITSPITAFAQMHDNRIERAINKLREDVKIIENNTSLILKARERTLGYDTGDLRRSYAQQYAPDSALKNAAAKYPLLRNTYFGQGFKSKAQRDMYEYYSSNSQGAGYQQEYQNLLKQRKDYLDILDKQESKKKKSQSDIEETKQKISELDDQIRFFSQDLAKELWSIDVKGWADQFSDALASAFENGESLAKAYEDTVTNILQSVFNKMLKMKVIEPMLAGLEDKLFGDNGAFDINDVEGSMDAVTAVLGEYFGKGGEGEKMITAVTQMGTAFNKALEPYGLSLKKDSSKTLSAGIQGTSEETSDLLAGYVNALRQDVSVNRLLLTQFVAEMWPSYFEAFVSHTRVVTNIDNNVQVVMEMMRDGRGAMYEEIHSLRSRIDNVVNGIESFNMK